MSLLLNLQGTSYVQTLAIQPGWNYTYSYSALNIFGESLLSPTVSIQAVSVPSTMLAPTLIVIGTDVKVSWLIPDNGGSPITGFHIYFMDYSLSTPAYTEYTSICDGTNAVIKSQLYCTLSMSTFISTFNYTSGQLLKVIVKA